MMDVAGLLQLILLTGALFAALAAASSALIYPRMRPLLARRAPAARAWWLFAASALPALAAAGLTALCLLPAAVWSALDHCQAHSGHPHLCLAHRPLGAGSLTLWIITLAIAMVAVLQLIGPLLRLLRARRALHQLHQTADFDPQRGVWVVDTAAPLAMTAGLVRSRTFLSSALITALAPGLIDAIIGHERAHARRHDGLRRLIATTLSVLHLPRTRRALLSDLALATEQACDEAAGAHLGDRLRVAQALLAVERLLQAPPQFGLAGLSFAGAATVPRVEALLNAPVAARPRRPVLILLSLGALLLLADPLHHLTETLLGLITGHR